jgi:glycosyltransferase involved in cell wall biosynthesis
MKIAFVAYAFGEYAILLASAIAEFADVMLIIWDEDVETFQSAVSPKLKLAVHTRPRLRQIPGQIKLARDVVREINDFDPDVIHLQQGHLWFNFALPFLRKYPLVITVHDPQHHTGDKESAKTPQFIMNAGYRFADELIVHANRLKEELIALQQLPRERVHVVAHLAIGDETASTDIEEEPNTILFFGRIWAYKGLDYLIKSQPLINEHIPDAKIIIAGRGEDFAPYEAMMQDKDQFIIHNRFIPDEEKHDLFRKASIVVLPYIEATVSGVIPTAYTYSKPVVATTVGGLPEMVEEGKTGYLVPPRDAEALAEAVVKILQDDTLRQQMGVQAKHKIDVEWSPEVCAQKTMSVYQQAIDHKKGT